MLTITAGLLCQTVYCAYTHSGSSPLPCRCARCEASLSRLHAHASQSIAGALASAARCARSRDARASAISGPVAPRVRWRLHCRDCRRRRHAEASVLHRLLTQSRGEQRICARVDSASVAERVRVRAQSRAAREPHSGAGRRRTASCSVDSRGGDARTVSIACTARDTGTRSAT